MIRGRLASGRRNQNLRRWEREMGQLLGNQAAAPRGIKCRVARWPSRATPGGDMYPGARTAWPHDAWTHRLTAAKSRVSVNR